jgi:hypothetical protein
MIWWSVKRRFKNGCTSSKVDGPPIFIITTAVGGLDDGEEVARARRDPVANNILMDRKTRSGRFQVWKEEFFFSCDVLRTV